MLGSPSGSGFPAQRGLWPLNAVPTPSISTFSTDGFNKYGVYSLFSGGPNFGSTLYSHSSTSNTTGRFATGQYPQQSDNIFHTSYKVSDSLFSTTSFTFGAPTPPPGSPYSPVPIGQLEFLSKGINPNVLQAVDSGLVLQESPKKIYEKHCEKCCNYRSQVCNCQMPSKFMDTINCCTRTNTVKWNEINLKKEPNGSISEISTNSASMIKLEVMSPTQQTSDMLSSNLIGLADPSTSSVTVSSATMTNNLTDNTVIQCAAIKSTTTGIETKQMDTASCNPSSIWQYSPPVAPVPMEPVVPVPAPPAGLQVVRDPGTGGLLLLSTNCLDSLQQAVVWSGYPQHPPMLLPSIPSVPPPFQLVQSTPTHCFSGTTFHQQSQAHSTRLVAVTSDTKRKIPLTNTAYIKIEADQVETLQPVSSTATNTEAVFTDVTPLITTHLIYQHPNFIVPQSSTIEQVSQTTCKSQATSPVTCLTPPPEYQSKVSAVQDASNQTDAMIGNEDNHPIILSPLSSALPEKSSPPIEELNTIPTPIVSEKELQPQDSVGEVKPMGPESKELAKLSLTGLELLSNSIDHFESSLQSKEKNVGDEQPTSTAPLEGLDLLCALAEQRILEENEKPAEHLERLKKSKKNKRKSKRHSTDEPKRKKLKSSKYNHEEKKKHKKMNKNQLLTLKESKLSIDNSRLFSKKEEEKHLINKDMETNVNPQELEKNEKTVESVQIKPKKLKYLKKHFRSKSLDFDRSAISPIFDEPLKPNREYLNLLKPADLVETLKQKIEQKEFYSFEKHSASKKRKVGRPKKLMPLSTEQVTTETIVAKKPKSNFIEYFLAAKERFRLQNYTYGDEILPSYEEGVIKVNSKKSKHSHSTSGERKSKIKPKLKAEPIFKSAEECETMENIEDGCVETKEEAVKCPVIVDQNSDNTTNLRVLEDKQCILTADLLQADKLRVLTAMGGLFYAGHLNAIEPPDVYSIVLDGERGNKPHIMSREEILKDAIVEIAPQNTNELVVGTRVCAYWSQQYRCLYPGSIAESSTPEPELDDKFVLVEFDDGDSGRINLKDIRFLPSDYPVIEYDLNPLLSLMKRKKKPSKNIVSKDCVPSEAHSISQYQSETNLQLSYDDKETTNILNSLNVEKRPKNKFPKKEKQEKLHHNLTLKKRKSKKHKCYDKKFNYRKHHKKHKKHKKHHKRIKPRDEVENLQSIESSKSSIELNTEGEFNNQGFQNTRIRDESQLVIKDLEMSTKKIYKIRDRQGSCESRSKMSAFLPARQLWGWAGKEYKRLRTKGRFRKFFYKSIQRGKEIITVGDSAVFLSTGRPDRPYIGKIEAMWELFGTMIVKVKWFYHPEETIGCPQNLQYPGALFESPHIDENDVQTISHKCEVVPLKQYTDRIGDDPKSYAAIYDNNDIYYLAGYYDPTTHLMKIEPGIPFSKP